MPSLGAVKSPVWKKLSKKTILSSTTLDVDTIQLSKFHALRYIVELHNDSESKTKSFEVSIIKEGVALKDSVFNKLGKMSVTVSPNVSGSNFKLSLTNNETYTITANVVLLSQGGN